MLNLGLVLIAITGHSAIMVEYETLMVDASKPLALAASPSLLFVFIIDSRHKTHGIGGICKDCLLSRNIKDSTCQQIH